MVVVVGVVIILVMAGCVLKSEPLVLVRSGYACPSFLWLRIVVIAFGIVVLWCCLLSHPSCYKVYFNQWPVRCEATRGAVVTCIVVVVVVAYFEIGSSSFQTPNHMTSFIITLSHTLRLTTNHHDNIIGQ
jgi:hypothetical protein